MTSGVGGVTPGSATPDERLRRAAHDLEGVFLSRLFAAMRATVESGEGILSRGPGDDMFAALLDQQLGEAAAHQNHGIGDALYRQLRGYLTLEPGPDDR